MTPEHRSRCLPASACVRYRALPTAIHALSENATPYPSDLFIYPGYRFHVADRLLTNFHSPRSTLLMLVCAFASRERVLAAYEEAVAEGYRFYSYGDAMLVRRRL